MRRQGGRGALGRWPGLLFCVIAGLQLAVTAAAAGDRVTRWEADLEVFSSTLAERHIDAFHQIPASRFAERIGVLKERIDDYSDLRMTLELMRLAAAIGDGHTAVHFNHNRKTAEFPITFFDDQGTWRVIAAPAGEEALLGSALQQIDSTTVPQLQRALGSVAQFVENPYSRRQRVLQYSVYAGLLFELGLIESPDKAAFRFVKDGKTLHRNLSATTSPARPVQYPPQLPKLKPTADAGIDGLWFAPLPNTAATYVRFAGYPSFEQMDTFGQTLLGFIRDQKTRQLIIDLRGNGGGDFYVGVWLAYYLNLADSLDWKNGVYTLVDNHTFSAATINAAQYRELLSATIVGEPTGSNPTGYQDMDTFELPNSRLMVSYSKRRFRLQEKADSPLMPDLPVMKTWSGITSGRDEALQAVIERIPVLTAERAPALVAPAGRAE